MYDSFSLQGLLSVHDTVARKSYDPELPPLPDDIDDEEDSVKIIRLVKNKEPLVRELPAHTHLQTHVNFHMLSKPDAYGAP